MEVIFPSVDDAFCTGHDRSCAVSEYDRDRRPGHGVFRGRLLLLSDAVGDFSGAFEKVRDELRHKNYRLFGMGMISTFTVNLFYLYRIFSRIKPVNFVIKELLDQPLAVSVSLLVFLLFLALLFPAFFVFHGCMIGQKSYWDSRFESMELLKGRWAQIIGMAALLESG